MEIEKDGGVGRFVAATIANPPVGPLKVVSVAGHMLTLRSESGETLYFDADLRQFVK